MASLLFLCYHGIGHINPCFALARILENEGHTVTLATVEHFSRYVTRAGFRHYPLKTVPFGLGFESWMNKQRKVQFLYWANLKDRFTDRLYHAREEELLTVLNSINPDVIFIDGTQATDFIVLYRMIKEKRIANAILHAMFPTHVLPGRPPADCTLVPGNKRDEMAALRRMNAKINRTDLRQRLAYFGMSDRHIINRRIRINQVSKADQLSIPSLFDFQADNVPSLILAPREFDYPNFDNPPNYHYIGFINAGIPSTQNTEWSKAKSAIHGGRSAGSRLVYCSFGTVSSGRESQVDSFLLRLAEAVTEQGDQLVVSIGKRAAPPGLVRSNVWVFSSVPQMEVLQESDVFVTHGGLSSIKEAVEAVVPMLMIVVHDQFDPPGNAARVQYHGMGILGDIDADAARIQVQLNELMTNEQYQIRIKQLRDANNSVAEQKFLELFNTLIQSSG